MKKLAAVLLVVLTIACVLTSCETTEPANPFTPDMIKTPSPVKSPASTPKDTPPDESPEPVDPTPPQAADYIPEITDIVYTDTKTIASIYTLTVTGYYPKTGVPAIDSFYEAERDRLIAESESFAEEISTYDNDYDDSVYFPTEFSLDDDYEIIKNSSNILSVHRMFYIYSGGAHGSNGDYCDNFRISDGKRLTLDDIFDCTSDEYRADICRVFDAFIEANSGDNGEYYFFDDAKETLREYFPANEFCITDNGLLFFISPYYIGPYAAGTIEIPVAWADLTVTRKNI